MLYTGYLLSIVKIKREMEREREEKQQIIKKVVEIDTHLFVTKNNPKILGQEALLRSPKAN